MTRSPNGYEINRVTRLQNLLVRLAPGEVADRLHALVAVVLMGLFPSRDPDEVEALGEGALVGEVVQRRQQFAPGQVAGRPEDDERRRCDRQALEAESERVLGLGLLA